jgi:hypothetical protein
LSPDHHEMPPDALRDVHRASRPRPIEHEPRCCRLPALATPSVTAIVAASPARG